CARLQIAQITFSWRFFSWLCRNWRNVRVSTMPDPISAHVQFTDSIRHAVARKPLRVGRMRRVGAAPAPRVLFPKERVSSLVNLHPVRLLALVTRKLLLGKHQG